MLMRLYENGNELPGELHPNEPPQIGSTIAFKAGDHIEKYLVEAVEHVYSMPHTKCGRINVGIKRL